VEGGADKEIKDEVRKLELISDGAFQRHDDSTLSRAASTITQRPIFSPFCYSCIFCFVFLFACRVKCVSRIMVVLISLTQ
jgi:hypothetical protein